MSGAGEWDKDVAGKTEDDSLLLSVKRFPTVISKWDAKGQDNGTESSESSDDASGGVGEASEASGR